MVDKQFYIPLKPVTKKNSQRIIVNSYTGKRMIIPSKAYKDYERDAVFVLRRQYTGEPINTAVNVKVLFYIDSDRKVDITNLLEAIDDILVKAGILEDDNRKIIAGHDGTRVFVNRRNPHTDIYITDIEETQ